MRDQIIGLSLYLLVSQALVCKLVAPLEQQLTNSTGKTLFLFVLLVLGLQKKQIVALQINQNEFVLFDQWGVSKHGEHANFKIPNGAWTLADSESHGPCSAFRFSKGHLIYTSSPASGCWKGWSKQYGARVYTMDVWSLPEFRTLLYVQ